MWAPLRLACALLLSPVTVSVDIVGFVEIVRSSDEELRRRYHLPTRCDPVVSAIRVPRDKVEVSISCVAESPSPLRRKRTTPVMP
jgi:hypothetical protein